MPFTPFHFGPGLLFKALAPRRMSWVGFCLSQVAIDCETLYYIVNEAYPLHRTAHTFIGATVVGLAVGGALCLARDIIFKWFPRWEEVIRRQTGIIRSETGKFGLLAGSLVGGVTHPFFDGVMHRDVVPFWPFLPGNPFWRLVHPAMLHQGCLLAGVVGLVGVVVWSAVTRDRD